MKKTLMLIIVLAVIALVAVGCGRKTTGQSSGKKNTPVVNGKSESEPVITKQPVATEKKQNAQNVEPLPANPTAKDIIDRAVQTYKGIKTLQMDIEIQASQSVGKEKMNDMANLTISFERPNKLKVVTHTGNAESTMVTDGKHAYVYSPTMKQYKDIPAPKEVFGGQNGKGSLSTMDLLAGKDVSQITKKAKLVKSEKVGNVDTYLIEAVLEQTSNGSIAKERTWIGKNDSLIYRIETSRTISVADQIKEQNKILDQIEAQAKQSGQKLGPRPPIQKPNGPVIIVQKSFVKKIVANGVLPANTFKFKPPKGAKKIDPNKLNQPMPTPQAPKNAPRPLPPQPIEKAMAAPNFNIPSLDGKQVSLSQFKGKPVLIAFWSTLSNTSKDGMPQIQKLYDSLKGSGVTVIGISLDGDKSIVQDYVKTNNITFPILFDREKATQTAQAFSGGQLGIPSVFVVDKKGMIKGVFFLGKENSVNGVKVSDPAKYMKSELANIGIK